MKQLAVTLLCLFAALSGFAHPLSHAPAIAGHPDSPAITSIRQTDFQVAQSLSLSENLASIAETDAFGKCTFKIDMEINGVHVEGTLTIEDVNFFECAAMKIAKFFSDLF